FLWLATHDGIARFDGQRFQVYDSMRVPAMSGNRILSLHLDAQHRLYAHSAHGDWLSLRPGPMESALPADAAQDARHVDPDSLCVTTSTALHCPDGDGRFPRWLPFPSGTDPARALRAGSSAWMSTR